MVRTCHDCGGYHGSPRFFDRMNEKSLPLDPNQLFLFSKEEMSSMKISRLEEEVCKSEEAITRTIKVKEKPVRK